VWLDFGPTGVLNQPLSSLAEDSRSGTGVSFSSLNGSRVFGLGTFNGSPGADIAVDVDVDQPLMVMSKGALTITAWFNPTEIRNAAGIQVKDTTGAFGSALSLDKAGHIVMMLQTDTGDFRSVESHTVVHTGEWTHVSGVVDTSGCMSVFVNGKLEETKCDSEVGFQSSLSHSPQILVGGYQTDQHQVFFKGSMADVRVFSRSLTKLELDQVRAQAFNSKH
jgi:hypothetical protein